MPVIARRTGKAISEDAKQRIIALKQYPTLDTFRNPLTRGIARHFAHEAWTKALSEIDFEYRISDLDVGDVHCAHFETANTRKSNPLILYIHGGGFVCGSPRVNAATVLPVCHLTGCEAIGVDYTLLPEATYPTQIDEIDRTYSELRDQFPDREFILLSDSAGGALTLSALMRWRNENAKLPSAAIFISPLIDGKGASDTAITLDGHDPLIRSMNGKTFQKLFQCYAPGMDLGNPDVSPLYGDFQDLPPILVHIGTREVLLGDAARMVEKAHAADVDITLRLFHGMFHLFQMHWKMDEAKTAHADIAMFIKDKTNAIS